MSVKAYVLRDVVEGKSNHVAEVLQAKPGVVSAEVLEGPPDVVMVVEADQRLDLAKLTLRALASVEDVTNDINCLPVSLAQEQWEENTVEVAG